MKDVSILNRSALPELRKDIAADVSEIRELKFNKVVSEAGHDDYHLQGQLFTKSVNNGGVQIAPCSACVVNISFVADTSNKVNMVTERDGFFKVHMKGSQYTITINNAGMNPMKLENIEPLSGGITTLKIINAIGSTTEQFMVLRQGQEYTWNKIK
jgi:hypothetical protein